MLYYKNLDLSYYTNDLKIKEIHLNKYKLFLTMILMTYDNEVTICKKQIEEVFSETFFHNIIKEIDIDPIVDELNKNRFKVSSTIKNKINQKKFDDNFTYFLLFHRLFERVHRGHEFGGGCNIYTTRLKNKQLEHIIIDFDNKLYKNNYKLTKKYDVTSQLLLDKNYIINFINNNEYIYGKQATFNIDELRLGLYNDVNLDKLKYLTQSQINKRKYDFQVLKSIIDNLSITNILQVKYERKNSGRLYTSLGLNIQGMTKEIRNILLSDYYENDISSSSPNFFIQVYNEILENDKSIVDEYIKNKKLNTDDEMYKKLILLKENHKLDLIEKYTSIGKVELRHIFGSIIKGTELQDIEEDKQYIDLSKEIMTMIFFNSKIDDKELFTTEEELIIDGILDDIEVVEHYQTSIQKVLTIKQRDRFFNSEIVKDFLLETDIMMNIVSFYLKKNHYNLEKRELKINGYKLVFKDTNDKLTKYHKGKALGFFYQSWESHFLVGMKKTYEKVTKDKNYLLLHDGIYTKKKIDNKLLENSTISKKSDFIIKVKID